MTVAHPLAAALSAMIEHWQGLVPFALWLTAPDGRVLAGAPCPDGTPCPSLQKRLAAVATGDVSGTCDCGRPYVLLDSDATGSGLRLGAAGFAPDQQAAVEAALHHCLAATADQVDAADLSALEAWSHQTLQEFYEAFAEGTGDVQAMLGRSVADAARTLGVRVLAVALVDQSLGTLEVAAVQGAPFAAVRHFVEGYGPKLGFCQASGEPVFLPPLEGGWGPGWAVTLEAPGGPVGLMLAWSDESTRLLWQQRLSRIGRHLALIVGAARLETEWQESLLGIFGAVAAAVDAKAPHTAGQSGQATLLALAIADELQAQGVSRRDLRLAGLLHDIGNLGVPDAVLTKAGTLTADEHARMRQHPEIAARMLADVPRLAEVRRWVLHHHERWDGSGYPRHLRGAEIPLGARILAVADAMTALLSPRPYRDALGVPEALAEIRAGLGSQFDPDVGEALFRCLEHNPGLLTALANVAGSSRPGGTGPLGERQDETAASLRLPVMPRTIQRLHELVQIAPKPAGEVISLLSADPALSARIMRYANSRRLGFARQITTVSQVVMLLGLDRVCNLALGFGLYDSFLCGEMPAASGEFIGPHGLLTATGARLLCQVMGQEAMEDEAFMAGMLHDVGRALLAQERPDQYAVIQERHAQGEDLLALERSRLGTDHAAVGAEAARSWGLPPRLVQAIALHHEPDRAERASLAAVIAVASELAHFSERKEPVPEQAKHRLAAYLLLEAADLAPVLRTLSGEANPILLSLRPERR